MQPVKLGKDLEEAIRQAQDRHMQLEVHINKLDFRSNGYVEAAKELSKFESILSSFTYFNELASMHQEFIYLNKSSPLSPEYLEECASLRSKMIDIKGKLKDMVAEKLSSKSSYKDIFLEVRAATGGEEARLFCADLSQMYLSYLLSSKKWKVKVVNISNEGDGYREIIIKITGAGAFDKLVKESGVHRVQRVPATESQGRVHTSTATVVVIPAYDPIACQDIKIEPRDLKIDTMRSSGAGGQHVNKTDSAVRITHIPTGIKVECQNDRSQHRNKSEAMDVLRARLLRFEMEKRQAHQSESKLKQMGTGGRSERIRTYNYPQKRITDHRINRSFYKFDSIMRGEINEIIDSLQKYDV